MIFTKCLHCSAEIETYPSRIAQGRGRYCSKHCSSAATSRKHGGHLSRTYASWQEMRRRCLNPRHVKYPRYGGAGIKVCAEWESYETFLADMGERPEGTSIDRIDGARGYYRENCRWATPREQQSNLSNNRYVVCDGEKVTLSELARRTGIGRGTLEYRRKQGWPLDTLLSPPETGNRSRGPTPV